MTITIEIETPILTMTDRDIDRLQIRLWNACESAGVEPSDIDIEADA